MKTKKTLLNCVLKQWSPTRLDPQTGFVDRLELGCTEGINNLPVHDPSSTPFGKRKPVQATNHGPTYIHHTLMYGP